MVLHGNQTRGGGHAIVYSEVTLKCTREKKNVHVKLK